MFDPGAGAGEIVFVGLLGLGAFFEVVVEGFAKLSGSMEAFEEGETVVERGGGDDDGAAGTIGRATHGAEEVVGEFALELGNLGRRGLFALFISFVVFAFCLLWLFIMAGEAGVNFGLRAEWM